LEAKLRNQSEAAERKRSQKWEAIASCSEVNEPAFLDQMEAMDESQTEQMLGWKDKAQLGLAEHELAARCYTNFSFFLSVLPNTLISALAGVLVLLEHVPHKDIVVAILSAASAVITTVAAFFNWQGEAEKHRSALKEYNVLMQRIEIWVADRDSWPDDLAHRAKLFKSAHLEIHGKILQIKKEVPPVPAWIRDRAVKKVSTKVDDKLSEMRKKRESEGTPRAGATPRRGGTPCSCRTPRCGSMAANNFHMPVDKDTEEAASPQKALQRSHNAPAKQKQALLLPLPHNPAGSQNAEGKMLQTNTSRGHSAGCADNRTDGRDSLDAGGLSVRRARSRAGSAQQRSMSSVLVSGEDLEGAAV